jgi:transposase
MSGVVRSIDWKESVSELYERYRGEADVGRRTRLQVLWLVRQGTPSRAAAVHAGVGVRTVTRWLGWYRQGGLDAVLQRVPGHAGVGVPCRLSAEQQEALLAQCAAGAFRTYGEAQRWVERELGVAYRYKGIHALLSRLDVHPKVPRPTAAKADPIAQAAWKKGDSDGP